jgi:hypothetical protein
MMSRVSSEKVGLIWFCFQSEEFQVDRCSEKAGKVGRGAPKNLGMLVEKQ